MSTSEQGAAAVGGADDDREIVLGGHLVDRTRRLPGRWQSGLFDVLVGAYVVGAVLAALASVDLVATRLPVGVGLLVLWLALVLVEGLAGGSPGKLVAGLEVVDDDGSPVGLRGALLRRPWGVPLLLVPIGIEPVRAVATVASALLLVVVGIATLRATDGVGWQDRLAGTRVRPSPRSTRTRAITIGVLLLLVVGAAIVRALGRGGLVA